ncbi:MAG TPA: HAMP domain-containing protein, partial [Gammaproteobacteria bacterium]|nr:HAMP domain-containing protein [Gammaproteobacteria bacterium]
MMKIRPSEISITRKLFTIVFIIYITVTLVMTTFEMHAEFLQEKNEIAENFDILQEFISPALADAIIQRSDQRLHFISEGVMRGPAIIGVRIEPLSDYQGISVGDVEPGQQKILKKKLKAQGKWVWEVMRFFAQTRTYDFTLYGKDNVTPLAEVTVYGDQALVVAKFVRVYALIVIDEILKTFLLWVLILWIGRKWLSIPLQRLTLATRAVAQGHMNRVHMPLSEKSTELDVLAQSFNIMVDKIQTAQYGLLNTKRH